MWRATVSDMSHLLTKDEAAARFSISRRTLERWIRDGRLSTIKPSPGVVRIDADDVDRLIEDSRSHAEAAPA